MNTTLSLQLTLEECCQLVEAPSASLVEMVEYGIVDPGGSAPATGASTASPWVGCAGQCACSGNWNSTGRPWPWLWTCSTRLGVCGPRTRA